MRTFLLIIFVVSLGLTGCAGGPQPAPPPDMSNMVKINQAVPIEAARQVGNDVGRAVQ